MATMDDYILGLYSRDSRSPYMDNEPVEIIEHERCNYCGEKADYYLNGKDYCDDCIDDAEFDLNTKRND